MLPVRKLMRDFLEIVTKSTHRAGMLSIDRTDTNRVVFYFYPSHYQFPRLAKDLPNAYPLKRE
jgi:hypothetical protein